MQSHRWHTWRLYVRSLQFNSLAAMPAVIKHTKHSQRAMLVFHRRLDVWFDMKYLSCWFFTVGVALQFLLSACCAVNEATLLVHDLQPQCVVVLRASGICGCWSGELFKT